MLATIRADFYRLFKTKGFWISQLVIIAFIIMTIGSQSVGNFGVSTEETSKQLTGAFDFAWTGVVSVNAISSMMLFFFYAMLPLLVIIVGHDFTKQTYKNILTVGISRTKYFLSQYLSFALMIFLQVIYVYLVSFLTGTLFYGVGDGFGLKQVQEWAFTGLVQFLMIMGIMTFSCLITYVSKNNIFAVLTAIVFPMVVTLLTMFFQNATWLQLFDFQSVMTDAGFILSGTKELTHTLLAAGGTIIALLGITIWRFNQIEL